MSCIKVFSNILGLFINIIIKIIKNLLVIKKIIMYHLLYIHIIFFIPCKKKWQIPVKTVSVSLYINNLKFIVIFCNAINISIFLRFCMFIPLMIIILSKSIVILSYIFKTLHFIHKIWIELQVWLILVFDSFWILIYVLFLLINALYQVIH